jgi:hypothetical protein
MADSHLLKIVPDKHETHKLYVCNRLASHFKIPKADLRQDFDLSSDIIHSPLLKQQHNLSDCFYCVGLNPKNLSLSILFNSAKFFKSQLYEDFICGEDSATGYDVADYKLALSITKDYTYLMYRTEGYEGIGGMFVTDEEHGGFAIEPLNNYLKDRFPQTVD